MRFCSMSIILPAVVDLEGIESALCRQWDNFTSGIAGNVLGIV